MSLPTLRVVRPKAVDEAVRILAQHGPQAMILAGGTDILPNLQMRLYAPQVLVGLKEISGLRGVRTVKDGALHIGALTTLSELLAEPVVRQKYPVLASAAATVAGPLQRNMATLGGNLCLETRCRWYNQSYFWRQSLGGCLKKRARCATSRPAATAAGRSGRGTRRRRYWRWMRRSRSPVRQASGASRWSRSTATTEWTGSRCGRARS